MTVGTCPSDARDAQTRVNGYLESIAWGVFLMAIGVIWLAPRYFPSQSWLIAAGLVMLGLNVVRAFKGISISGGSMFLGTLALAIGVGGSMGIGIPFIPTVLILIGAGIVLSALSRAVAEKPHA